jgi:hypothetical protein
MTGNTALFFLSESSKQSNFTTEIMSYLFSFSAKSLQSFVLEGEQLKTMTGATELIDRLCRVSFLEKLLVKARISAKVLQGAAGSGRILISDQHDAQRLARVWPVFCKRWAPGLNVVQALVAIDEKGLSSAIRQADEQMRHARNFIPPALPLATPVMERCRRTGRAAVELDDDNVPRDAALSRKAVMRNQIAGTVTPLLKCFGFEHMRQVPSSFEEISGSERCDLAVIHADGNGLGQMFMKLTSAVSQLADPDDAQDCFRYLSRDVIEQGTRAAAEKATQSLNLGPDRQVIPIQPIVLAGDDLTLVCRADLAWEFTTEFLRAFEQEMTQRLATAKQNSEFPSSLRDALPSQLTAGAGIAYVSGHYPFSLAYALAESLTHRAKSKAKGKNPTSPPSSIMFYKVSGAYAPTDFEVLATTHLRGDNLTLGAGPYYLSPQETPNTSYLESLKDSLRKMPCGSIRQLINLLATESSSVPPAVERMTQVSKDHLDFADAVKQLGLDAKLCATFHGDEYATPLPDAWTLKLMAHNQK